MIYLKFIQMIDGDYNGRFLASEVLVNFNIIAQILFVVDLNGIHWDLVLKYPW